MSGDLGDRIEAALSCEVHPAIAAFARHLARDARVQAVMFYGSNLRTGSLDGVLDYYVLTRGPAERGLWPRVAYREWEHDGQRLHAKIATMTLAKFVEAARGETLDTTVWARFVQPAALVWSASETTREAVVQALSDAVCTASRLAVAVGPAKGTEEEYWRALFRATYRAELRVEKPGRENAIIAPNAAHFDGLLSAGLTEQEIAFRTSGPVLEPLLPPRDRNDILRWWSMRRRLGKPLNLLRLLRATRTFEGAVRYAAWKIERHTGVAVPLTPRQERNALLAAPGLVRAWWRARRLQRAGSD